MVKMPLQPLHRYLKLKLATFTVAGGVANRYHENRYQTVTKLISFRLRITTVTKPLQAKLKL